jgi:hypothetical protein
MKHVKTKSTSNTTLLKKFRFGVSAVLIIAGIFFVFMNRGLVEQGLGPSNNFGSLEKSQGDKLEISNEPKNPANQILADGIIKLSNTDDIDRTLNEIYTQLFKIIDDKILNDKELSTIILSLLNRVDYLKNQNKLPPEFGSRILARFALRDPFDAWGLFRERYWGSRGFPPIAYEVERIVKEMAGDDVEKLIVMDQKEKLPGHGRAEILAALLGKDEGRADVWLGGVIDSSNASERDRFHHVHAEYLAKNGRISDAWELQNQIQDSGLKTKVEGIIWSMEREALRAEAGQDPENTLLSMISGESKYADYWLEEAVSTWMAKDFDKAQEWQRKNWESIPANKSQYLAAAFAKHAASQGAVESAREWASRIQDAKTKQRIDAGIAEAERESGK